jgi:hypothetical protein
MREASAVMAPQGRQWDLDRGWTEQEMGRDSVALETRATLDFASEPAVAYAAERTQESAEAAAAVAGGEKYVQIGENGSVRVKQPPNSATQAAQAAGHAPYRSLTRLHDGQRVTDGDGEDEAAAALLTRSGSFPSISMQNSPVMSSPTTTQVVKQKIGAEDFNLFPDNKSQLMTTSGGKPLEDDSLARPVPRRNVGPVDIDDIKPSWDKDGDDALQGVASWNSMRSDPPDNATEVGSIVMSSSGGSKIVPKLKASIRDTSPISERKKFRPAIESPVAKAEPLNDSATARPRLQHPSLERLLVANEEETMGHAPAHRETNAEAIAREQHLVKQRRQQWESRIGSSENGAPDNAPATDEWKSFLAKKADKQRAMLRQMTDPIGEEYASIKSYYGNGANAASAASSTAYDQSFASDVYRKHDDSSIADISAIARNDTNSDYEQATSEYGPAEGERSSFFKRFVECTAPIRAECQAVGSSVQATVNDSVQDIKDGDSMPMAHLAFLRSNAQAQSARMTPVRFVPPAFCGREDNVVVEKPDGDKRIGATSGPVRPGVSSNSERPATSLPRSQSAPRAISHGRGSFVPGSSASSVVSADGFGAKTAYLEALALKGAVSNSKRASSRARGTRSSTSASSVSVSSYASSAHSEKWKSFLEKKKLQTGVSSSKSVASASEVSKAAERYASKKLEEIMMSRRGQSNLDTVNSEEPEREYGSSVKAADELAAARVEAIMAALTSSNQPDEGEI